MTSFPGSFDCRRVGANRESRAFGRESTSYGVCSCLFGVLQILPLFQGAAGSHSHPLLILVMCVGLTPRGFVHGPTLGSRKHGSHHASFTDLSTSQPISQRSRSGLLNTDNSDISFTAECQPPCWARHLQLLRKPLTFLRGRTIALMMKIRGGSGGDYPHFKD